MTTLLRDYVPPNVRVTVCVLIGNEASLRFWDAAGFEQYAITLERHAAAPPPS